MKIEIPQSSVDRVRNEYYATRGRSVRRAVVERAATHFGVSYATMHRKLNLGLRTRSIPEEQKNSIEERNSYAKIVFDYAESKSHDDKPCSIKAAYEYLMMMGQLPTDFSRRDCYLAIERMNLKNIALEKTQRFVRFQMPEPLIQMQVDFTKSDFIRVMGDDLVMTDGRWSRGDDKRYLWIGAALDDHSRVHYAEFIVMVGENPIDAQRFMVNAMRKKDALLLQGTPRNIYFDRGPGFKISTQAGLNSLGIRAIVGSDHEGTKESNKQARGKIEALNKFLHGAFEQELHLKFGPKFRFSIGELNEYLREWSEWQNQQEHPTLPGDSKWNRFKGALETCQFPPKDALTKFATENTTTVRRRLIHTGKQIYWQAPAFVDEGAKVTYSLRNGECFLIWNNQEIKLQRQASRMGTENDFMPSQIAVETEEQTFVGAMLKERFDRELREITEQALSLRELSVDDYSDIRSFFQAPRSLAQIREQADQVKLRVLIPKAFDANERHHAKVIMWEPK